MKKNRIYIGVICSVFLLCVGTFAGGSFLQTKSFDGPTAPTQPTEGPGGSNYSHLGVRESRYGWGSHQFWIFEPTDPTPTSAPLIVFNHGWGAFYPYY